MTPPRVIYLGIRTEKTAAEVGGWSKVNQMGLRDALIYDTTTRKFSHYTKSEVEDLITALQTADLVVGFNQLNFDYKILATYSDKDFVALPNFDMLDYIEQTLNFRVSRDNLVQNTLGVSKNDKKLSNFVNKVDTTKKLFAHACKEGYLSYENRRFGGQDRFDTSNWAEIARNLSQREKFLAETKVLSEKNIPENPNNSIPNAPIPPIRPRKDMVDTTRDLLFPSNHKSPETKSHNSTTSQVNIGNESGIEEYEHIVGHSESESSIAEISREIQLTKPKKKLAKNGSRYPYRHLFIDGSGTLAPEWVEDPWDLRNKMEELARGI